MRQFLTAAAATSLLLSAASATAQTAPRQERPTTGDCVSDGFLGNEPNIVGPFAPGGPSEQTPGSQAGRVAPTQSPGPFVNRGPNEPPRNDRTRGASVGEVNEAFRTGQVPGTINGVPTAGARNLPQFCKKVTEAQGG